MFSPFQTIARNCSQLTPEIILMVCVKSVPSDVEIERSWYFQDTKQVFTCNFNYYCYLIIADYRQCTDDGPVQLRAARVQCASGGERPQERVGLPRHQPGGHHGRHRQHQGDPHQDLGHCQAGPVGGVKAWRRPGRTFFININY